MSHSTDSSPQKLSPPLLAGSEITASPIERVLSRLKGVRTSGDGHVARCPAHNDHAPSLSIATGSDGRVLLHCHAGCTFDGILKALDLKANDLFPEKPRLELGPFPRQAELAAAHHAAKTTATVGTTAIAVTTDVVAAPTNMPAAPSAFGPNASLTFAAMAESLSAALSPALLTQLASQLGLPEDSLQALHVGWHAEGFAWTFPERDAAGNVIGIMCRARDGAKKVWPGSQRGLYLPEGWRERPGPVLIVEGVSDTVALTAMGLAGVGRPNAKGGAELLAQLLRSWPADRGIIVVGEMDPKTDGSWPGRDGAKHVAEEVADTLRRQVSWVLPDAKDVRAWLLSQEVSRA